MRLVHETAGRLRFKSELAADPAFDPRHLRALALGLPGVAGARVNRGSGSLVIEYSGARRDRDHIVDYLGTLSPRDLAAGDGRPETGPPDLLRPALSGLAALAVPFLDPRRRRLLSYATVAPTVAKGLDALVSDGIGVEALDAASVGLAAARGEALTATVTQFLLDLAEYIEGTTAQHSDALLRGLLSPNPDSAWVERKGRVRMVPFAAVRQGDLVVVGTGEMVPVDGLVARGEATVNQASVTGESLPIPKEPGSPVLAGTLVEEGRLVVVAERVGDATTTARIARFIEEALARKSETQKVAEDLADKRVMITLGTAAAVLALTRDWRRVESVFLVDYSCAIKLGTPVAIKSAMYRAARHGILIKGGQALEALAAVDTVVFDKTGTLTHGRLEVTDVHTFARPEWPKAAFLAMVASVAEHTSHPIAAAVVKMARRRKLDHISHAEVDFMVGHGIKTRVGEREIRIGSRHYLEEHMQVPFRAHEPLIRRLEGEGKTLLFVGADGESLGLIALRDKVREEAPATLKRLREGGISTVAMLTGDGEATARTVADGLGVDRLFWGAAPEDKAGIVADLRREGKKVLFVGDGVNDGPALMAADVGISMARGADLARATAGILLMDDRLDAVAEAREMAGHAMGLIQANFRAAVGINTAVLAGASLGLLPPIGAALLHNGATIGVLLAALGAGRTPTGRGFPPPLDATAAPLGQPVS